MAGLCSHDMLMSGKRPILVKKFKENGMKYITTAKKAAISALLCASIVLGTCACETESGENPENYGEDGRIIVSMLYTSQLNNFEELVERKNPDIDLQIEINAISTITGQSERRLIAGHGTDIVAMVTPSERILPYLLDLSAQNYTSRYESPIIRAYMSEGKTKYIPLPGQYNGYIVNMTIAGELGFDSIKNRGEFMELFDKAKEKGLGVGEDDTMFSIYRTDFGLLGSYFVGTQVPDFLSTADGIIWSDSLRDKNGGSFASTWQHSLDFEQEMVEKGYLDPNTVNGNKGKAALIEQRMVDGTMLAAYVNAGFYDKICGEGKDYEYIMLPHLSDGDNAPWTLCLPDAFLGINASLDSEENALKLDACHRVLDFLSTEEGQKAFISDTGASHSYISGAKSFGAVPDGLKDCVENGYVYNVRFPTSVLSYMGIQFGDVLMGKRDISEAMAMVDDYYYNGSEETDKDISVVGESETDLICENYNVRLEETAIGNFVADAVREAVGADMAFINGGSIRNSIYKGTVMGSDLDEVCPYGNLIVNLKVSGKVIKLMLANGVSQRHRESGIPGGRFLNVSGLCYSFSDSTGEITSVTLPDGTPINDEDTFTIAVTDYMAGISGYVDGNGDDFTMLNVYNDETEKRDDVELEKETGMTCAKALEIYFENHSAESVSAQTEGRITVEN